MKKGTGVFRKIEETMRVCDNCGATLTDENIIYWDGKWYDYEDTFGGAFEVCSIPCLQEYLFNSKDHIGLYVPNYPNIGVTIKVNSEVAKRLYELLLEDL